VLGPDGGPFAGGETPERSGLYAAVCDGATCAWRSVILTDEWPRREREFRGWHATLLLLISCGRVA